MLSSEKPSELLFPSSSEDFWDGCSQTAQKTKASSSLRDELSNSILPD